MKERVSRKGPNQRLFTAFNERLIQAANDRGPAFDIKKEDSVDKTVFGTLIGVLEMRYDLLSEAQKKTIQREKADWEEALKNFNRYHDDPIYFRNHWHKAVQNWDFHIKAAGKRPKQGESGGVLQKIANLLFS